MQELIIHIGTHKTGSTAIQKALMENRAALAAHGFQYPDIGFHYYGHHLLQAAARSGTDDELSKMAHALNEIEDTVIISSENFSRADQQAIARIAGLIKCDKVRVIYYQRNILDLIYVWWQELVKHGSTTTLISYYAECVTKPLSRHITNPKQILDRWAGVFGRESLSIYMYDRVPDVVSQFAEEVLNLPPGAFKAAPRNKINKSFDVASSEFIRCLNMHGLKGVKHIAETPQARSLHDRVRLASDGKLTTIDIGFDYPVFSRIETMLQNAWGDRIHAYRHEMPLFDKRSRSLNYIDSSFWFENPNLAADIASFAADRLRHEAQAAMPA